MNKVIDLKVYQAPSVSKKVVVEPEDGQFFVVRGTASTNRQYGQTNVEASFLVKAHSRKQATDIYNKMAGELGWTRVIDGDARALQRLDTMENFKN